ncbi:MAG: hypothetical protein KGL29_03860 [Alphaproteobacteria bacterium]|nr:hypothetical protein [Alphaproteobacteria bacterium]
MTANVGRYVARMEEIKKRVEAIDTILRGTHTTCWSHTNFEFIALQFRKIFEIIVLATIDSNEGALAGAASAIFNEWQVGKIIRYVGRVNPKFFPKPAIQDGMQLREFKGEYLTLERLKEFHGRCGEWMHAKAPDLSPADYEEWSRRFEIWRKLTMNLLNYHTVQLADPMEMLWVGMSEKTTGQVCWNIMQLVLATERAS